MLIQLKTWESALGIYSVFKKTPLHSPTQGVVVSSSCLLTAITSCSKVRKVPDTKVASSDLPRGEERCRYHQQPL